MVVAADEFATAGIQAIIKMTGAREVTHERATEDEFGNLRVDDPATLETFPKSQRPGIQPRRASTKLIHGSRESRSSLATIRVLARRPQR